MVFGQWSDSRHFLYFSVFLVMPQYETVQFLPPLSEVGKQGSSVLMFHEATYQDFIVRFTLLKEVFPSLVCARAKSRTFQSLRLFEHTSPHASSGMHFNQGSKTPGTSPFGALPPVCATLQELRHVPHWLVHWSRSHLPTVTLLSAPCALSSGLKLSQPSVLLLSGWWPFA